MKTIERSLKANSPKRFSSILLITAGVMAIAACAPKPPPELPPEPVVTPPPPAPVASAPAPSGPVPGSQADFVSKVSSDRIFFDTDRFNIDVEDQATLQSQAQWLSQYPDRNIIVEGHADERGTRDYNLALGERRANAAKNYLASLGIAPSRIRVISYGKERPEALGSDESAWARNRRAVTVIIE